MKPIKQKNILQEFLELELDQLHYCRTVFSQPRQLTNLILETKVKKALSNIHGFLAKNDRPLLWVINKQYLSASKAYSKCLQLGSMVPDVEKPGSAMWTHR